MTSSKTIKHTPLKMATNNKKFLKNMVESASPVQLIVILYDGAIQWLQMARKEIEKNADKKPPNWTDYSRQMNKTHEILTHLQESLDPSSNKDLSTRLFDIYEFLKSTVSQANAYKKTEDIDNVIFILKDLRVSWQQAAKQ